MADVTFLTTPQGLIVYKGKRIAYRRPAELIVLASARDRFSLEDHAVFDALIANDENRRYINSFEDEFDWAARFTAFKTGTIPTGVTFTPAELGAVAALESAKEKIKVAFGLPEIPYMTAPAIDVRKIYGDQYDAARAWLDNTNSPSIVNALSIVATRLPSQNNLLRVKKKGNYFVVENLTGYSLSENIIKKKIWPSLRDAWRNGTTGTVTRFTQSTYGSSRRVEAGKDFVEIGCQRIPRAEVERIAALRGWDTPATA